MNMNYEIQYDNVLLRPLEHSDIESLRTWRNDESNNRFLRDVGKITSEMQEEWYRNYLHKNDEVFFSIEEINKFKKIIGALALYDISSDCAEIGKIQIGEKEVRGKGIGKKSLVMLMKFGFETLMLKRIIATVNKDNIAAMINHVAVGFRITGEKESLSKIGGKDFMLEIDFDRLKSCNEYINDISTGKL